MVDGSTPGRQEYQWITVFLSLFPAGAGKANCKVAIVMCRSSSKESSSRWGEGARGGGGVDS